MGNHVTFTPLRAFDGAATEDLASVGPVGSYREEWQDGLSVVFAVLFDGERIGTILMRVDRTPDGDKELVVIGLVAKAPVMVIEEGRALVEAMARSNDCKTVSFHTDHIGLARHFMKAGGSAIVTWEVPHGR